MKNLVALADRLDREGFFAEADQIDLLLKKRAKFKGYTMDQLQEFADDGEPLKVSIEDIKHEMARHGQTSPEDLEEFKKHFGHHNEYDALKFLYWMGW